MIPANVSIALSQLTDASPANMAAISQLQQIKEEDCHTLVQAFLEMPPLAAVKTLEVYVTHDLPCILTIVTQLLQSPNPLLGDFAARYLGQQGPEAAPTLLEALSNAHVIVQMQILIALENVAGVSNLPQLIELLDTASEPTLRYSLIQILGKIGDPRAIEPIKAYADDPNHHVRERVVIALKRLEDIP